MTSPDPARPPGAPILDPGWEEALRRGQVAAGETGSVEEELAMVHLLRHATADEHLAPDREGEVWGRIDRELAGSASVGRRWWVWLGVPALAGAAAAAVLWARSPDSPAAGEREPLQASAPVLGREIERQFAALEPRARAALTDVVEDERARLRRRVLTDALPEPAGGAP